MPEGDCTDTARLYCVSRGQTRGSGGSKTLKISLIVRSTRPERRRSECANCGKNPRPSARSELHRIGDGGWLSEQGRTVKQRVESLTDDLAGKPYEILQPRELDELTTTLEPFAILLLAAQD